MIVSLYILQGHKKNASIDIRKGHDSPRRRRERRENIIFLSAERAERKTLMLLSLLDDTNIMDINKLSSKIIGAAKK